MKLKGRKEGGRIFLSLCPKVWNMLKAGCGFCCRELAGWRVHLNDRKV
jgi:hypothetical protein